MFMPSSLTLDIYELRRLPGTNVMTLDYMYVVVCKYDPSTLSAVRA